jgi:hypothetical protein
MRQAGAIIFPKRFLLPRSAGMRWHRRRRKIAKHLAILARPGLDFLPLRKIAPPPARGGVARAAPGAAWRGDDQAGRVAGDHMRRRRTWTIAGRCVRRARRKVAKGPCTTRASQPSPDLHGRRAGSSVATGNDNGANPMLTREDIDEA